MDRRDDDYDITDAQAAALTLDHAYFEDHPGARQYTRRRLQGEFGEGNGPEDFPQHGHVRVTVTRLGVVARHSVEVPTDD